MAETYSGKVIITFYANNIACDGSLNDFVNNMFPDGWIGELMEIDGEITEEE